MKTKIQAVLALAALAGAVRVYGSPAGFVAHEWGTFTSVQGGDGALVEWRPLQTSKLPGFVYDWTKAGLNRVRATQLVYGKGDITCLQRMETPVIYFYADREQTVDVSVRFPKGVITEWYPQASRIGPAMVRPSPVVAKLDALAYRMGAQRSFNLSTLWDGSATMDSGATWDNVQILPPKAAHLLPLDASGSHYFAARETDANLLRLPSLNPTNPAPEVEKFIFYRGVGDFATPLMVKTAAGGRITLSNRGPEPLGDLFLLDVQQQAKLVAIPSLAPGEERTVEVRSGSGYTSLKQCSQDLGQAMVAALTRQGLYPREASAMVKTWKDSWFEEKGMRVLYLLPRAWTDRTLPLKLTPAPRELVRVMVGRAEALSPELDDHLRQELAHAGQGDPAAKAHVQAEFHDLGRFAEPALRLALAGQSFAASQSAWALLQESQPR